MPHVTLCTVLYIEDDPDDIFLFKRAFLRAAIPCDLHCLDSIDQARSYLLGVCPYSDRQEFRLPDLIMTDLTVKDESGLAFVQWLRAQPDFARIAVACLTGSDDPRKLREIAGLGIAIIQKSTLLENTIALIRKLIVRA